MKMRQRMLAIAVALTTLCAAVPAHAEDPGSGDVQELTQRVRAGRWILSAVYLLGAGSLTIGALTWRDIRQDKEAREHCKEQKCPTPASAGDKAAGSIAVVAGGAILVAAVYETVVMRERARELDRRRTSLLPAVSRTTAGLQVRLVW